MLRRLIVMLLLSAVLSQACWALGEIVHSHDHGVGGPLAQLFVDPHLEAGGGVDHVDHDSPQRPDTGHEHHHGCNAHQYCATPTFVTLNAPPSHAFIGREHPSRGPDAPAETIDRPNW